MGTVQLTAVPVQLVCIVNVVPSLCRILMLYPVIGEPPFADAIQVIITSLPEIEVVGVDGVEGAVGGNIAPLPSEDAAEKPKAFMA